MRTKRAVSLLVVGMLPLVLVVCASGRGSPNPPPGVDLSGTWILDREASDDLAAAIASRRGSGQVVRRGGGGGGGGVVRGGGGGGGGRMITREGVTAEMEMLGRAPSRFTLEQSEGAVSLTFPDGRGVSLQTTGDTQRSTWLDGVDVEMKADWRDSTLRIERSAEFVSAVETYTRNGNGNGSRLTVTTTLSGGMGGDITVRRHYDLETAS